MMINFCLPLLAPCCVDDDVALAYGFDRTCERQTNFAPDDFIASSWDFPPLRNTKYTCTSKRKIAHKKSIVNRKRIENEL